MDRAFLAEGPKLVNDLLTSGCRPLLVAGEAGFEPAIEISPDLWKGVSATDLKKVSLLKQPHQVVAVFELPEEQAPGAHPAGSWGIALDRLQDPGNMGTILRTMDWLGITRIYAGNDSVDIYNPKVVQASMGAIARIEVFYVDLAEYLAEAAVPVYAAETEGTPLTPEVPEPGILVFGNEGAGLSADVRAVCTGSVSIPGSGGGESLNAAVSAAIIAAWMRLHS